MTQYNNTMSQSVERLIVTLKELDLEEKQIKESRNLLQQKLKQIDDQLDQISSKRSLTLKELESANSTDQSESEFQSLCSDNSIYPKSSDIDSDEFSQKRKDRSDSPTSDVEVKKVRSNCNNVVKCPNTIEEINDYNQDMVDKCINDMAYNVIKDLSGTDLKFKDELEKLSEDPDFESLVKDIENDIKTESILKVDTLTQTSPSLMALYRSNSTDGNFKENVSPSAKVRRTSSNRFKYDQQCVNDNPSTNSTNKSNKFVVSTPFVPSNILKGKKILSNLLSDKHTNDDRIKHFGPRVDINSNCFKENMFFWERKATEENFDIKPKNKKKIQIKDIIDSI
jgi:hypothetical protein